MRLEHLLSGDVDVKMTNTTNRRGLYLIYSLMVDGEMERLPPLPGSWNKDFVARYTSSELSLKYGGLAQLARAPALQAGGQRFESVILHELKEIIDMLETQNLNYRKSKAIHRGSSNELSQK